MSGLLWPLWVWQGQEVSLMVTVGEGLGIGGSGCLLTLSDAEGVCLPSERRATDSWLLWMRLPQCLSPPESITKPYVLQPLPTTARDGLSPQRASSAFLSPTFTHPEGRPGTFPYFLIWCRDMSMPYLMVVTLPLPYRSHTTWALGFPPEPCCIGYFFHHY